MHMRLFFFCSATVLFLGIAPGLSAQPDCAAHRPIVFVHGFLASGDTWSNFVQGFRAAGYCPERLFVFDWNTLDGTIDHKTNLDAAIDALLARTGADRVDLVGHSAGGGMSYLYLIDSAHAAKVARFVQIGSMNQHQPAGPNGGTPTMNLWSDQDRIMGGKDMPGTTNVMLSGFDHYKVATSRASFEAVFRFLNDAPPPAEQPKSPASVRIGGRAVFFGQNRPASGSGVELYYLNSQNGARIGTAMSVKADEQGFWAIPDVRPGVPVELVVRATETARPVHYFREGFARSSELVYLRALPDRSSTVGIMLAGLPTSPKQSVVNVFSTSQAVVFGRDTLSVDDVPLSTETLAPSEKSVISFFLYDGNSNNKSELLPIGIFGRFPFLAGLDVFINPKKRKPMQVFFNGRRQVVRKIPASEGIQVVVFD
ncbi:MAG: alpha/beta fold hydrolase [Saprospiraceae bacterium]